MPSGKNWVNFLYINIAFAIYIAATFYFNQVAQIKANWPLYRCNPMYMVLADNVDENFVYCIQTMQSNFMGYLLQPLTFLTGSLSTMMGGFMGDIQSIRAMFNKIRTFFSAIIESVFGVFLNLVIEFIRITVSIKDLMAKTIGIMVSLMYVLDGSVKTMQSTWNGPPGQMVRALGKCFHPFTNVRLQDGTNKYMKDVALGDVLQDGSVVECVMSINNRKERTPFYYIKQTEQDDGVLVTGSHLVFDASQQKFVQVNQYHKAVPTDIVFDYFSCLITDTHRIQLGNEVFWDWEDHFVKAGRV
jgi:hypothetical protein